MIWFLIKHILKIQLLQILLLNVFLFFGFYTRPSLIQFYPGNVNQFSVRLRNQFKSSSPVCEPVNIQHQYCVHNVLIISAEVDTMSSMAYLKLIISIASLKETFLLKCKLHKCTIAIQPNPKNLYFKDLIILFWAPSWLSPMSSFSSSWLHRPGEM